MFATVAFFIESIVTANAGIYALLQPLDFMRDNLPPHLTSLPLSSGSDVQQVLTFTAHVYGLVLVLLGLAEAFMFMVPGQVRSKRSLLLAMAVGDAIHLAVFWSTWFRDPSSGQLILDLDAFKAWVAAWGTKEWTTFHANISLVSFYLPLRLVYMATAREPVSKGAKGGKQL